MNEKSRDISLAILSTGGIFYLIGKLYGSIINLLKSNLDITTLKFLVLSESFLFLIFGLIIWKKIKLSDDYSKYLIIFLIIGLLLDFIYKLLVIF
jgi:hypothetical protein